MISPLPRVDGAWSANGSASRSRGRGPWVRGRDDLRLGSRGVVFFVGAASALEAELLVVLVGLACDDGERAPEGLQLLVQLTTALADAGQHLLVPGVGGLRLAPLLACGLVAREQRREERVRVGEWLTAGVGHRLHRFHGITDEVCLFGVNERELRDLDSLIGTLGHEVAHAYRFRHGLEATDRHVEELLTDLTSVYLGFGVFLLNSSHVFRTGGYDERGERLLYETKRQGYLSPSRIAVLLGAQAVVRNLDRREQRAISEALAPNQAMLFGKAVALLGDDPDGLRERLNVPPPEAWEPGTPLSVLTRPLPPAQLIARDEAAEIREELAEVQRDEIAFLIDGDQRWTWMWTAGGVAVLLGLALANGALYWPLVAICTLGGYLGGMQSKSPRCSACGVVNSPKARRCQCGLMIAGRVRRAVDRFDAEERYWAERSAARQSPPRPRRRRRSRRVPP